ncbi:MAG TPA: type II toxin-antitoxin system PemK/MazF family toxin [Bryobacteraceae bacterium]|jgi:mRNA interferase MazF|nr:type II toxin-antitoxin system PemK/MazF family toxin [Bryobacteraceae bacterium]
MRPGEIFLASFPFGDIAGMKLRPVLVLAGPIGPIPEVLVAYISSVLPTALMPSDLVLDPAQAEFRSTNLKTASVLRLHKLATIHASMIARHLGDLPDAQKPAVAAKLRDLLAAW